MFPKILAYHCFLEASLDYCNLLNLIKQVSEGVQQIHGPLPAVHNFQVLVAQDWVLPRNLEFWKGNGND